MALSLTACRLIPDRSDHSRGHPVDLGCSREGGGHEQAPGAPLPDRLGPRASLHQVPCGKLGGGTNIQVCLCGGRLPADSPAHNLPCRPPQWDWEESWDTGNIFAMGQEI